MGRPAIGKSSYVVIRPVIARCNQLMWVILLISVGNVALHRGKAKTSYE